jgi:hypothetical protein
MTITAMPQIDQHLIEQLRLFGAFGLGVQTWKAGAAADQASCHMSQRSSNARPGLWTSVPRKILLTLA